MPYNQKLYDVDVGGLILEISVNLPIVYEQLKADELELLRFFFKCLKLLRLCIA